MAKFTLDGTPYEIGELSFEAVERAWPYIAIGMTNADPIAGVSAGIAVLCAGIMEAPWFSTEAWDIVIPPTAIFVNPDAEIFQQLQVRFKKKLKAREIGEIRLAVIEVVREAGLLPQPGEAPDPVLEAALLASGMETAPQS